jgi:hypothetical protein
MIKILKTTLWALGVGALSLTQLELQAQLPCATLCPAESTQNNLGSGISVVRIVGGTEVPLENNTVRPGDTLRVKARVIYISGARAVLSGSTQTGSDWRIRAIEGDSDEGSVLATLDAEPVGFDGTVIGTNECGGIDTYETSIDYTVDSDYADTGLYFDSRFRGRYFDGACAAATKVDGITLTVDPCVDFNAEEAAGLLGLDECQSVTCDAASANKITLDNGIEYGYKISGEPCCEGFDSDEAKAKLIEADLMDQCQEVTCDTDSETTVTLDNQKTYKYSITGETCCDGFDPEYVRDFLELDACVIIDCDPANLGTELEVEIEGKKFGYSLDDSECEPEGVPTGCTPGFWKNCPYNWSDTGYNTTDLVSSMFTTVTGTIGNTKLIDALSLKGGNNLVGSRGILIRAAVAAVLNASNPALNYPLSKADIQALVDSVYNSTNRADILALAKQLDDSNNLGCLFQDGTSIPCNPKPQDSAKVAPQKR